MADAYTDLRVVECNRLHSEEASTNNNENFALWTNNLQDIVHLEAGDKVSVHGAMVSERGAGQASSIEIKGVPLGFEKTSVFLCETHVLDAVCGMAARSDTAEGAPCPSGCPWAPL